VIALGGIVCDKNIRVAGDEFTSDIEEYMRRQHNILVGERTAEQIKIEVGAPLVELDDPPPDYAVRGRDLMTGIPKEITVTYSARSPRRWTSPSARSRKPSSVRWKATPPGTER
jgi:rod shape-determining protein MreB